MEEGKLNFLLRTATSKFARTFDFHYADVNTESCETIVQHRYFKSFSPNDIRTALEGITPDENMKFADHIAVIRPIPEFFSGLKATSAFRRIGITAIFADNSAGILRIAVANSSDIERIRHGCIKNVEDQCKPDFERRCEPFLISKDPKFIVDNYKNYCIFEHIADEQQAERVFRSILRQCNVKIIGCDADLKE